MRIVWKRKISWKGGRGRGKPSSLQWELVVNVYSVRSLGLWYAKAKILEKKTRIYFVKVAYEDLEIQKMKEHAFRCHT